MDHIKLNWLGWQDSNLRILESKSSALPLGDIPISLYILFFYLLAGVVGFEPTNARVRVWCLTAWRYPKSNAPRRIRTPGTRIRSPLLYPSELWVLSNCGAGEGNRTLATSLEGWGSTIELHPHNTIVIEFYFYIHFILYFIG